MSRSVKCAGLEVRGLTATIVAYPNGKQRYPIEVLAADGTLLFSANGDLDSDILRDRLAKGAGEVDQQEVKSLAMDLGRLVRQRREQIDVLRRSGAAANRQTAGGTARGRNGLEFAESSPNTLQTTEPPPLAVRRSILPHVVRTVKGLGAVGVADLVALLYLVLTSRLLNVFRPVSLAIKGPSGGGKSFPVEQVLRLFPEGAAQVFTAVTDKALIYDDQPLAHRTLILLEAHSLNSDFLSYLIRTLLSEGHAKYLTTEKGEDGAFHSREIVREGPTGLIVTTTAAAIEAQTETRILSATVKDTPEQTKRIMRAIAKGPQLEPDLRRWHDLQRWLAVGEKRVVVPFACALAETIQPVAVRLRRDFTTLLALIASHALLHRANRAVDSEGRIMAEVEKDYGAVRQLVAEPMGEGVAACMSKTLQETVQAVEQFQREQGAGLGMNYTQLARALNIEVSSAQRRAEVAIQRGYLVNHQERDRRPAQLVRSTDPLPDGGDLLPPVHELLEVCRKFASANANTKNTAPCDLGESWHVGGSLTAMQPPLATPGKAERANA